MTDGTTKLAVVTGASSGIGYELAREFARNGFDVVAAAEDDAIAAAATSIEEEGTRAYPVQADLSTFEGVEKLVAEVEAIGRPVDAVALNAGIGVGGDFTRDTNLLDELKLIDLNVSGTVHLAKRLLPDMVDRGEGKVLFTSSIAATMPGPFEAVYAASKAFVQSFSEALRNELKDTGVTVTALQPGPTETEFFERAGIGEDTKLGSMKKDDPAQVAKQGFDALMKGEQKVVAGSVKTKVQGYANRVTPDAVKAAMHAKQAAPGSA